MPIAANPLLTLLNVEPATEASSSGTFSSMQNPKAGLGPTMTSATEVSSTHQAGRSDEVKSKAFSDAISDSDTACDGVAGAVVSAPGIARPLLSADTGTVVADLSGTGFRDAQLAQNTEINAIHSKRFDWARFTANHRTGTWSEFTGYNCDW